MFVMCINIKLHCPLNDTSYNRTKAYLHKFMFPVLDSSQESKWSHTKTWAVTLYTRLLFNNNSLLQSKRTHECECVCLYTWHLKFWEVIWDVMPCTLVDIYQHSGAIYYLHPCWYTNTEHHASAQIIVTCVGNIQYDHKWRGGGQ